MSSQITRIQFVFLLMWVVLGTGLLTLPYAISQSVVRDAWLVGPMFFLGPLVMAAVCHLHVKLFGGQSLVEALKFSFGRWLGTACVLFILVWAAVTASTICRQLSIFININFLPTTPNYVVALVFMATVSYAVYLGLETVGRLAEVVTPPAVLVSIAVYMLALRTARLDNVMPVLAFGISPVLKATVLPWMFSFEFILSLIFASSVKRDSIGRDIVIAGLIIACMGMVSEFTVTAVLGNVRTTSNVPLLAIARSVRLGEFLDRIDPVYVISVVTTMVLKMAYFQYALCLGLTQTFGLSNYKSLVVGAGMLTWALSIFLFKDHVALQTYFLTTFPAWTILTCLVIPVAAMAAFALRRRFQPASKQKPQPRS